MHKLTASPCLGAGRLIFAIAVLFSVIPLIHCDVGPCHFDSDECSCSEKNTGGGICWDKNGNSTCTSRPCNGGWTCLCEGRTHLCETKEKKIYIPTGTISAGQSTAQCEKEERQVVLKPILKLGFLTISLSFKGILKNDCNRFKWFLNGETMGTYPSEPGMNAISAIKARKERQYHKMLELKEGDVIAFRFIQASYYCFSGSVYILHNGTVSDFRPGEANARRFEAYYSDHQISGWKSRDLELEDENTAPDETSAASKGRNTFILFRSKKLSQSHSIITGLDDLWEPRDNTNPDNRRSNWYFRMKIPKNSQT